MTTFHRYSINKAFKKGEIIILSLPSKEGLQDQNQLLPVQKHDLRDFSMSFSKIKSKLTSYTNSQISIK